MTSTTRSRPIDYPPLGNNRAIDATEQLVTETGGFLVGDEVKIPLGAGRAEDGIIRPPRVRGDRCPCAPKSGGTTCSGMLGA
jgi:hypothetical protein